MCLDLAFTLGGGVGGEGVRVRGSFIKKMVQGTEFRPSLHPRGRGEGVRGWG